MGELIAFRPRQIDPWKTFQKIANSPAVFDFVGMIDLSHSSARKPDESLTGTDLLFQTDLPRQVLRDLCEKQATSHVVWEFSLERMDKKMSAGRINSLRLDEQGLLVRLHFVREYDHFLPDCVISEHLPRELFARVNGTMRDTCCIKSSDYRP